MMQLLRKSLKAEEGKESGGRIKYVFGDGSQLFLRNGRAQKYVSKDPSLEDRDCKDVVLTEEYLEFNDLHLSSPVSERVPYQWRNRYPGLFAQGSRPQRIRICFDDSGRRSARRVLDDLERSMHQIEHGKQQRIRESEEKAALRGFIDEHLAVSVGGQAARVDDDGEVSCPKCGDELRSDPDGYLTLLREAIESRSTEPMRKEGLVHCRGCNELYALIVEVKE